MPAEYAYTHADEVGGKVVVIGGGLVGAELALHLASCGKDVTIMHRHACIKCGANGLHGQAINEQIRIHKVGTAFNTSPVEITDDGVIGRNAEGEKLYPADTVIYAVGQRPLADEAEQFRFHLNHLCFGSLGHWIDFLHRFYQFAVTAQVSFFAEYEDGFYGDDRDRVAVGSDFERGVPSARLSVSGRSLPGQGEQQYQG